MRGRGAMRAGLVVLALAMAGPAEGREVAVAARKPLAAILISSRGPSDPALRALRLQLAKVLDETDLALREYDASVSADCRGSPLCMTRAVRNDRVRWLLLVSIVADLEPGSGFAEAILVDTEKALEGARAASGGELAEEDAAEREGIVLRSPRAKLAGEVDVRAFVHRLYTSGLRPFFEASGDLQAWGAIEVDPGGERFSLYLDGVLIGAYPGGERTRLIQVPRGPHQVRVEVAGHDAAELRVLVPAGETVALPLEAATAATAPTSPAARGSVLRPGFFWAGIAAAAAGVALTAAAAVEASKSPQVFCVEQGTDRCGGAAFVAFGASPDAGALSDPNPGSVLIAPLGLSLVGAGATWSLGSRFIGDPDEAPWLSAAAGLAVGAAIYGIAALAGGGSAFR